jgi:tetratricopeptide (TPR) repeat protein
MRLPVLVIVLSAAVPLRAAGQPDPAATRARVSALVTAATRHFDAREYRAAAAELRAAIALDPQPRLFYALGQAERLSGECARAIEAYQAFLRTAPTAPQAAAARDNIARCSPAGPDAALGGPGDGARAAPRSPPPGADEPALARGSPWYRDVLGGSLCASGVIALITGGILWAVGADAIDAAPRSATYGEFESQAEHGRALERGGVTTLALGGALVAAGVIRYLLRPARAAPVTIGVTPAPSGGAVVLVRRF